MEKDRVLFFGLLCFIIGIAYGSFFHLTVPGMLLGGAFFIAASFFSREQGVFLLGIFFSAFLFGAHLSLVDTATYQNLTPTVEEHGVFRVMNDPEEKEFFQNVYLRTSRCESNDCPNKDVLWQAPLSFRVLPGDLVFLSCQFVLPKNFDAAFDYRMFLAKNGVGYICEHASDLSVQPQDWIGKVLFVLFSPKHIMENALSKILPEPEAGLAKGLLLGGNGYLSSSLQEKFTRIGLSHMIAVSGYNITLIAQCLLAIGLFFGLWRKHALVAAVLGITLFILMIGVPASALRAGIMAGVVFAALQAGRIARQTNALLLAAALMLVIHPLLLRYDLGFQLSFLATLAIIQVLPFLDRYFHEEFFGKSALEIILMTFSVEIFVLPVILFSFHAFSPLVFLGNFLVLLVPFIMTLAFFSALLFILLPGAHVFFAWVSYGLLTIITRSVEWLGNLSGTSIEIKAFGISSFISWYVCLGLLIIFLRKRFSLKRYEEQI